MIARSLKADIKKIFQSEKMREEAVCRAEIRRFARSHKDFEARRSRMIKLLLSGQAHGLSDAYRLAAPKRAKRAGK